MVRGVMILFLWDHMGLKFSLLEYDITILEICSTFSIWRIIVHFFLSIRREYFGHKKNYIHKKRVALPSWSYTIYLITTKTITISIFLSLIIVFLSKGWIKSSNYLIYLICICGILSEFWTCDLNLTQRLTLIIL